MVSTIPIAYLSEEQRRSIKPSTVVLSAFGGSRVQHFGHVTLSLEFEGGARIDNLDFLVTKMNTVPLIGNNVLLTDDGQLKIDTKANKATIRGTVCDIFYSDTGKTSFVTSLTAETSSAMQRMMVEHSVTIPANTEMTISVKIKLPPSTALMMTEPQAAVRFVNGKRHFLPISKGLYSAHQFSSFPVRVANTGEVDIHLKSGSKLGSIIPLEDTEELNHVNALTTIECSENRVNALISEMDIGQISANQMDRLKKIVRKHQKTILLSDELPGVARVEPYKVYPKADCPVSSQTYRTPYSLRPHMRSILRKQVDNGLISRGHSPWNSPTLLVQKPNGDYRLVIDFRKVNQAMHGDSYPLPRIPDLLTNLKGSRIFSAIDLCQGYHQVPLADESKEVLAMGNEFGQFIWNVMPQGTAGAPSHFQRIMDTVFEDVPASSTICYLDDVLCHAKSIDENLDQLEQCFGLLADYNLQMKACKAKVLHKEIVFCGHKIRDGKLLIPDKGVQAVRSIAMPKSKVEAQKVYGLLNYLRGSIPEFARLSKPITKTFGSGKFVWTEDAARALDILKQKVVDATQGLQIPDVNTDTFVLESDASDTSMGACLYVCSKKSPPNAPPDWHDHGPDCLKPVEFFSANFTEGQCKKLFIREKELHAFRRALKKWEMYLLGRTFIWRTDNRCNSYANEVKKSNQKVARILAEVSEFQYIIQRRSTNQMAVSDALSRPVDIHQLKLSKEDFGKLQKMDPVLNKIHGYVSINRWPKEMSDPELLFWKKKASSLKIGLQDELILERDNGPCLVVPTGSRTELIKSYHDDAFHPGGKNTFVPLSQHFTWYGMKSDVESYTKSCDLCQKTKPNLHVKKPPLKKTDTPTQIFEKISVDLIGPLSRTNRNNRWVLVANDHFSKRVYTRPLTEKTASKTLTALKSIVFQMGRLPRRVLTDNGLEFASVFHDWLTSEGIVHNKSAPYSPTTNGLTERSNQSLKNRLKPFLDTGKWDDILQPVTMQLNLCPNEVTGYSPIEIEYGLQGINPNVHVDIVSRNLKNLDEIRKDVRKSIEHEKESRVAKTDRHFVPYSIGDKVLMKALPSSNSKTKFIGPFIIEKIFAEGRSYRIKNDDGVSFVRQCKDLKTYTDREEAVAIDKPNEPTAEDKPVELSCASLPLYPNAGIGWPLVSLGAFQTSTTLLSTATSVSVTRPEEDLSPSVQEDSPSISVNGNQLSTNLEDMTSLNIEDQSVAEEVVIEETIESDVVVPEEVHEISGIVPIDNSNPLEETVQQDIDREADSPVISSESSSSLECPALSDLDLTMVSLGPQDATMIEVPEPPTVLPAQPSIQPVPPPLPSQALKRPRPDDTVVDDPPIPVKRQTRSSKCDLSVRSNCPDSFLNTLVVDEILSKEGLMNFMNTCERSRSFRLNKASQEDFEKVITCYQLPVVLRTMKHVANYLLDESLIPEDDFVRVGDQLWPLVTISEILINSNSIPVSRNPKSREFCLGDQNFFQLCTIAIKWKATIRHSDLKTKSDLERRLHEFAKSSIRIQKVQEDSKTYWQFR